MSVDIVQNVVNAQTKEEEIKLEKEEFEISEVKYKLNTVENPKKAKENVSRNEEITRLLTDDTNIRFEL